MSEQLPSDEQAAYDAAADEARTMRMHIWRLHCRIRELIAVMELRPQTPVSTRLIGECQELIRAGQQYE